MAVVVIAVPPPPSRFPLGSDHRIFFVLSYFLLFSVFPFFGPIFGFFRFSISTPSLCYVYLNCIPSLPRLPSFLSYIIIYPCIDISISKKFSRLFSHRTYTGHPDRNNFPFSRCRHLFLSFLRRRHVFRNIII